MKVFQRTLQQRDPLLGHANDMSNERSFYGATYNDKEDQSPSGWDSDDRRTFSLSGSPFVTAIAMGDDSCRQSSSYIRTTIVLTHEVILTHEIHPCRVYERPLHHLENEGQEIQRVEEPFCERNEIEDFSVVKELEKLEMTPSVTTEATESSEFSDVKVNMETSPCCIHRGCGRGLGFPGWKAYNDSLDRNPVLTKAVTSLCGWFIGDFITQTILTNVVTFDFHRSLTMSCFGFFFHGPIGHFIYDNLDQIIVGTGAKEIISKICVDQLIWCPVFMVCYFSFLGVANGESAPLILDKIQEDLFTAVAASWKVWPLAHAIQFRYVATKHRIIYINSIEVCFIVFLSFLANR